MVDLKNIIKSAETANKEFHDGYPPVEKWNPEPVSYTHLTLPTILLV